MDVYKVLIELIKIPNAPKFYRELQKTYETKNMKNEAAAISYLIEQKFGKKDQQCP